MNGHSPAIADARSYTHLIAFCAGAPKRVSASSKFAGSPPQKALSRYRFAEACALYDRHSVSSSGAGQELNIEVGGRSHVRTAVFGAGGGVTTAGGGAAGAPFPGTITTSPAKIRLGLGRLAR